METGTVKGDMPSLSLAAAAQLTLPLLATASCWLVAARIANGLKRAEQERTLGEIRWLLRLCCAAMLWSGTEHLLTMNAVMDPSLPRQLWHIAMCIAAMALGSGKQARSSEELSADSLLRTPTSAIRPHSHKIDTSEHKLAHEDDSSKKLLAFVAFLCHEIRNPLFAITSNARFLSEDFDDDVEQRTNMIDSIQDSALYMLRLVNDVLDLSKWNAGKLELESRPYPLMRVLDQLVTNTGLQLDSNAVTLNYEISQEVPEYIVGDSTRLQQIVNNLLSNACKYTKHGEIKVTVGVVPQETLTTLVDMDKVTTGKNATKCKHCSAIPEDGDDEDDEDENDKDGDEGSLDSTFLQVTESFTSHSKGQPQQPQHRQNMEGTKVAFSPEYFSNSFSSVSENRKMVMLQIAVADTGPGIEPDRLETIFQPYAQAKASDYRQHGGTGLGLAIISSLLQTMDGTVAVESTVGIGSTFTLNIPVAVANAEDLLEVFEDTECGQDSIKPEVVDPKIDLELSFASNLSCSMRDNSSVDIDIKFSPKPAQTRRTSLSSKSASTDSTKPSGRFSSLERKSSVSSMSTATSRKSKRRLPSFDASVGTVLVVDDGLVNRKIIGKMLSHYAVAFEQAQDGRQAVDMVLARGHDDPYAMILMDLSMPVMDGIDATLAIRAAGFDRIPIVALTADGLMQEQERAFQAGATDFKTKPILREDLHEVCVKYLGGRREEEESVSPSKTESSGS